jgi:hypothetical protein
MWWQLVTGEDLIWRNILIIMDRYYSAIVVFIHFVWRHILVNSPSADFLMDEVKLLQWNFSKQNLIGTNFWLLTCLNRTSLRPTFVFYSETCLNRTSLGPTFVFYSETCLNWTSLGPTFDLSKQSLIGTNFRPV